jgi:hypothetical protein
VPVCLNGIFAIALEPLLNWRYKENYEQCSINKTSEITYQLGKLGQVELKSLSIRHLHSPVCAPCTMMWRETEGGLVEIYLIFSLWDHSTWEAY